MILLYLNHVREFIFRNENIIKLCYTKLLYFQRLIELLKALNKNNNKNN